MPDPLAARRIELAADGFVSVADAMLARLPLAWQQGSG
jgi:hypothetical protein